MKRDTLKCIWQIETLGRTHKATLVAEDSTDIKLLILPSLYFDLSHMLSATAISLDIRVNCETFLPAAGGLLIS